METGYLFNENGTAMACHAKLNLNDFFFKYGCTTKCGPGKRSLFTQISVATGDGKQLHN